MLHDQRESIREEAVCLLDAASLPPVLALLAQPPLVTWSVHAMLLASCASAGIQPPTVSHLSEVDNLWLAEDLARLEPVSSDPAAN